MQTRPPPGRADLEKAALLERARMAIHHDQPREAEAIARGLLRTNAGDRGAAKLLGYALIMLGRADEAVALLEKAARGSHDPELETQLAVALQRCGRNDDAIHWFARAIKRKGAQPSAFIQFGFLLNSLYRHREAIEVLKKGVESAPMVVDMTVQLGLAYSGIYDRVNAIGCFTRALAMNPGHLGAMSGLGDALINNRDFAQAADVLRRLVAADPANSEARIKLGNCLLTLGDAEGALACMRAAAAHGPKFYGKSLRALAAASHGRFWLKPSDAARALGKETRKP